MGHKLCCHSRKTEDGSNSLGTLLLFGLGVAAVLFLNMQIAMNGGTKRRKRRSKNENTPVWANSLDLFGGILE